MHDPTQRDDDEQTSPPAPELAELAEAQLPESSSHTDAPEERPGRSTGPRSAAGKAKSSMNRLTHGLRSDKTILRDEDPAEFEATVQGWLDIYNPEDRKEDELVNEIIHAHWHLKRAKKRLEEIEWNVPGNAWNWTDEHQQLFANFSRYKTTAERSFARWYKEMESHRGRQFREDQLREKASIAAAAIDLKWLSDKEKTTNEALKVTQFAEIEVEAGVCTTSCYPSNQEIVDLYATRDTPPIFVKRLLLFPDGVPPEYSWTHPKRVHQSEPPQAVQNMVWSRWLTVTEREEASGTGHVGPIYNVPS